MRETRKDCNILQKKVRFDAPYHFFPLRLSFCCLRMSRKSAILKLFVLLLPCLIIHGYQAPTPKTRSRPKQLLSPPSLVRPEPSSLAPDTTTLDVITDRTTRKASFQTWARRLNTREDRMGLHKLSGTGFVLSSTCILLVGLQSSFQEIPHWLYWADNALVVSTVVQATSSIGMAFRHRKRQPWIRDQFIAMAFVAIFVVLAEELLTPVPPALLQ